MGLDLRCGVNVRDFVYNKRQTLRLRKVNCDIHLAGYVAVSQRLNLSRFRNLININRCLICVQIYVFSQNIFNIQER